MIEIVTTPGFESEKLYVIEFVFNDILGVDYNVQFSSAAKGYLITTEAGKSVYVPDVFFSKAAQIGSYLTREILPSSIGCQLKDNYTSGSSIPVIYGIAKTEDNAESVFKTGADIFGSIFFMLSRCEEYIESPLDKFDRFIGKNSIAYRLGFIHRPVVNEYVEWLWKVLQYAGSTQVRKQRNYELIPTHDVDRVTYPIDVPNLLGDIKNTRNLFNPIKRLMYGVQGKNPYNTFSWMMLLSERAGVRSVFNFMSNGKHKLDNSYSLHQSSIKHLIKEIKDRGHIIGFHPGYDSYNDSHEWNQQYDFLCEAVNMPVTTGRQHYLRLSMPTTLQIWDQHRMQTDSSLGYSDVTGFRCGTGDSFYVFNCTTQQKMELRELPLIFMDNTLHSYSSLKQSLLNSTEELYRLKSISQQYKMPFTILFHNSSFDDIRWPGWAKLYSDFMLSA